ncbi:MAG: DNA methyltransferase [Acidobacteriota bacterium]
MYKFIEASRIAISSILAHKLRSFLTLLGVIIGVAVVTAVATVIEGANLYDPFCGTGTTNYVAQRLGRKSVGIDLSPHYIDIATERCRILL